MSVHFSSKTGEWETPQALFDELDARYVFTLDVCATKKNAKCQMYYNKKDDGLSKLWYGSCWMNPPYGNPEHPCKEKCKKKKCKARGHCISEYIPGVIDWVAKAYKSNCKVVALLPARTDTKWFHNYIYKRPSVYYRFLEGRLKFSGHNNSAPFPSMIVVFPRIQKRT